VTDQSALRDEGSTRAWRELRAEVLEDAGHRCAYCGDPATHVDHRTPRSAGGTDSRRNLAASCARCNLGKGTGSRSRLKRGLRAALRP